MLEKYHITCLKLRIGDISRLFDGVLIIKDNKLIKDLTVSDFIIECESECFAQIKEAFPDIKDTLSNDGVVTVVPFSPKEEPKTVKDIWSHLLPVDEISYNSDGACSGNTNMEYRVCDHTGVEVTRSKVWPEGTNNIAEFLGLYESLKLAINKNVKVIYTDSVTAMSWLKNKKCNTTFDLSCDLELEKAVDTAIRYVSTFDITAVDSNTITITNKIKTKKVTLKKWKTKEWEIDIPSDFGRK